MASSPAPTPTDVFYVFSLLNRWPPSKDYVERIVHQFKTVAEMRTYLLANLGKGTTYSAPPSWVISYLRPEMGQKVLYLTIPELARVLFKAASEGWGADPTKVQAAIEATTWWRTHNETQRNWTILSPADQDRQVQEIAVRMAKDYEAAWGKPIDFRTFINSGAARRIASGAIDYAMWQADTRSAAAHDPNTPAGREQETEHEAQLQFGVDVENLAGQLERTASETFAIRIDRATATDWATKIRHNDASLEDFRDFARAQAAAMYPHFAEQIKAGVDPAVVLSGYAQAASAELGRDVSLTDPTIQGLVSGSADVNEFRRKIRELPEYETGTGAKLAAQAIFAGGGGPAAERGGVAALGTVS